MEQILNEKEVYFGKYCGTCKYKATSENDEPCEECLTNPSMLGTHKPLKYEKGVKTSGRKQTSK